MYIIYISFSQLIYIIILLPFFIKIYNFKSNIIIYPNRQLIYISLFNYNKIIIYIYFNYYFTIIIIIIEKKKKK